MRPFLKYHLPAILYALAVLVLPSLTGFRTQAVKFLVTDKLAHFLEYAVFAFLIFRSLTHLTRRLSNRLAFTLSLCCLAVFALLDEVLQAFIPGRRSDMWDYAADLTGGVLVLAILVWRRHSRPSAGLHSVP